MSIFRIAYRPILTSSREHNTKFGCLLFLNLSHNRFFLVNIFHFDLEGNRRGQIKHKNQC